MSSRSLIKSMMIIGSAQAANVAISLVRMKVLALLLGPAGIGLLSIFTNLHAAVSGVAGLGMVSSGVRQIAAVRGEEPALSRVRRVLFAANLVQGLLAMAAVWLLREPIAVWVLGDAGRATEIGLVGIAVLFAVVSASQTALLRGMRRIGDLGRVTVAGSLAGTVAGLGAVWLYGSAGLIWFVIAQPLAAFLVARLYTRRLPPPLGARPALRAFWSEWRPMARLGVVFMLAGLSVTATLLIVRSRITQELGLDAAGQFAAAWGISVTYIGFLLGAMSADYYPQLTGVIHDRKAANRLINDQLQLGLAIGGPVLLLLVGGAPWVIRLLYSAEFEPAASLLQWQTAGNVFKLASWPLAYALMAAARAKTYIVTELSWNLWFLVLIWAGFPLLGLGITGIAFLVAYLAYFALAAVLVRRLHGFRWEALSLRLAGLHAALAMGLLALALSFPLAGAIAGACLAAATGLFGGHVVLSKVGGEGRAAPLARLYTSLGWPIASPA